ncbi:hypothetical protein ABH935_005172 [Catenulispora sp. GAS73]|uniref:hypothetical protein n=1 Tax=Catenulispora sp. GAS73 TaxID=3156269 RepID=UPI0035162463
MSQDEVEIDGAALSWDGESSLERTPRMQFCVDATAAGGERSVITVDAAWLNAGIGGTEIVVSPDEQYAALYHYSGQSEEGYCAFRIKPQLEYVGGWDECGEGETPVFSPGSQYLAHILITRQGFLSPSGEPDSEFDFFEVPDTRPLVFEYADLRVHELPAGGIKRYPLRVHLPADFGRFLADQNTSAEEWLGESFMTQLEFVSDQVLRIQCTKLAEPVDVKLPITGPVVFDLSGF